MPIGFPRNVDVTDIKNIEPLEPQVKPLSEAIRMLDELLEQYEPINHRHCVKEDNDERYLRGDVHTAKCRVRDAYNRCLTERHDISEYRADIPPSEKYEANVEQVEGYLGISDDFLVKALDRLDPDVTDDKCSELQNRIENVQDIIKTHQEAAQQGIVYAGPPLENTI